MNPSNHNIRINANHICMNQMLQTHICTSHVAAPSCHTVFSSLQSGLCALASEVPVRTMAIQRPKLEEGHRIRDNIVEEDHIAQTP